MYTTIIKNSLEISYKLINDLGKEVKRVNSILLVQDAIEEDMLAVSIAVNKIMQYAVTDTINVKRTMIVEW